MRAWRLFQGSLVGAMLLFMVAVVVSVLMKWRHGGLNGAQTDALLALLYWGTYPLVFLSLGALAWHFVRLERGDYA